MAKAAAVHFTCAECGYSTGRWLGRCPSCGNFGTLAEEAPLAANGHAEAKPLLLYRGSEELMIDGIRCVPVERFLRGLRPNTS